MAMATAVQLWVRSPSAAAYGLAFSPDGARIVSGGTDNVLRLWDARSGALIGEPLKGHTDSVNSVAFSPDGARIVSGSQDNTLRLWDARSGAPIGEPLKGHTGFVNSVAFSPDGARVVSGSWDMTLRLWPVLDAWAEALCAKLGRNISPREWKDWVASNIPYRIQCPQLPVPAN